VIWGSLSSELRTAGLSVSVPRFSTVALPSVVALLATGTAATIIHMPAVNALWETGYGKAILVKIGLLTAAICLASVSRMRAKPRIVAGRGDPELGASGARLLRRTVSGEAFLVAAEVFAAAVLSSLAPAPPAFAEQNSALASVGPGQVARTLNRLGYRLQS
jgi:copper transport protein